MANPQKENGYTPISNEIMDALCQIRINGESRQLLDFILRKTYGYNKKEDKISLSQFCLGTGLKRPTICKGLKKLKEMNIITQKDNSIANIYGFNKDFSQWKPLPKKITQKLLPKKIMTITQKDNLPLPKKIHTKDIITKDNITKERTPAQKMKEFLENPEPAIQSLISRGVNEHLAREEIRKFMSYWSELNKSGTRQKWEKQETFEVGRRLATWFNNIKAFNKPNNKIIDIPE